MAARQRGILHFWQELKRRNVIRRNTVYAATAFVILELVSIIQDPLKLPEWTLSVVIIFLSIGFIVSIVISWIYDFNPEGGLESIKQLEKLHKDQKDDRPGISSSWKIATYISFVVILALLILNLYPRDSRKADRVILDKSIAILPFINDSPEKANEYFINGTMEAILDNLSRIEDLRVISRTSVEQYRDKRIPIPEIAREMNVGYVLEGSGQKSGDHIRLFVQLVNGTTDEHLWSKEFTREIKDIFSLQSEIARLVATELEAIITPEEKTLIEKVPTTNQTAWDLFIRAWEERDLSRKEQLFRLALEYDPKFGWPYVGLSYVYWQKYENPAQYQHDYLDSIRYFAEKALSMDDQLASAYHFRGHYHRLVGDLDNSLKDQNKAIEIRPNYVDAMKSKAWIAWFTYDLLGAIENFHYTISLDRGPGLANQYRNLSHAYMRSGFREHSELFSLKALELDRDSLGYWVALARIEHWLGNDPDRALELIERGHARDTGNFEILLTKGYIYLYSGQYEKSLSIFKKLESYFDDPGEINIYAKNYIGLSYWMNGQKEKANFYFDQQIDYLENRLEAGEKNYDYYSLLAQIYALRGEKDKALQFLEVFDLLDLTDSNFLKDITLPGPFYSGTYTDPDFQEIAGKLQAKYQAKHEKIRQWLDENDVL